MKLIITLAILFLIAAGGLWAMSANATETPDYKILSSDGKIETRAYPPMILAEVTVRGDRDTAASRGFSKLAGFIFGDNRSKDKIAMTSPVVQKSEKIAMTSPVVQTPIEGNQWIINFMMPSKYTMATLPEPMDGDIKIYESEPYKTISLRFNGTSNPENLKTHLAELNDYIQANDIKVKGSHEYAFYDAPYVPGPVRRNEVHYRLAEQGIP